MYRIRLMYAIVLATAFMLLIAWTGAIAVNEESAWYASLIKPRFVLSGGWHSAAWGLIYCIFIYLLARLVSLKKFTPCLPIIVAINVTSAVWTVVFFRGHSPLVALVILFILVGLNFLNFYEILKRKWPLALLYLPVLVWYGYCFVLNYSIYALN